MRIATVVGARPQFIKAAPVSRVLRRRHDEVLIHTGQHYDTRMSDLFFDELAIPDPDHQLGIGSGPHGKQTGEMLAAIEQVLTSQAFDVVLIYGDTNSTLAGALAAAKLHLPVAHVEAGLRSFNRTMPEEINRVVADHLADILFCPTEAAVRNLADEGITRGVHNVGDVMLDTMRLQIEAGLPTARVLNDFDVRERSYVLATIHRAENTDDPSRLRSILAGLEAADEPVVLPLHPRTRAALDRFGLQPTNGHVRLVEPLSFAEMLAAEASARVIVTDSGGVQKEACWLRVPCVTVRSETEWVETVESGWNVLVGTASAAITDAIRSAQAPARAPVRDDTSASDRICSILEASFD
ncbi:MAG TPA: UDP-N-acetylglucosamine 2-epimerase (non-hydrolyzing) [Chloroflexota bacterium]